MPPLPLPFLPRPASVAPYDIHPPPPHPSPPSPTSAIMLATYESQHRAHEPTAFNRAMRAWAALPSLSSTDSVPNIVCLCSVTFAVVLVLFVLARGCVGLVKRGRWRRRRVALERERGRGRGREGGCGWWEDGSGNGDADVERGREKRP
ncbi:hypothetical protein BKA81DRAFT_376097 [Phyllosticta paracitricarpa]